MSSSSFRSGGISKILLPLAGIFLGLLTVLFLWFAIQNFWIASRMRNTDATVVASALKIDWGRPDSESVEQPLYLLRIDLRAADGSARTFHWEGDPGQAVYPEEALDEFKRWSPGTHHNIATIRGNSRELRLDQLESNPEIGKGVGWIFGAFFMGMFAVSLFAAGASDPVNAPPGLGLIKGFGIWIVFLAFGIPMLIGSMAFGWGMSQKILSWQQITSNEVGEAAAFDITRKIPNVEITAKALKGLEESLYKRLEFRWSGQTLHAGLGSWQGVYDIGLRGAPEENGKYRFFISPKDRWEVEPTLSWGENFGVPFGTLLFFGVAFTGASLAIRSQERRFR